MPRHTSVKTHTRTVNGKTTTVRRHGREIPWTQPLLNARGQIDRERLATAGKAAATAGGGLLFGTLTAVFHVGWAAATLVSVACVAIIWTGTQLLVSGTSKRRASRPRRKRPAALRWSRRGRLWWYRRRQRRLRSGKGSWSWRQTAARAQRQRGRS